MKDIDFDELDKAVNSLMGSVGAPEDTQKPDTTPKPEAEVKESPGSTESRAATPAKSPMIKTTSGVIAPKMSGRDVSPVKSTPAVKRTGRFMDVVDSSSERNPFRKPISAPVREGARSLASPSTPIAAPSPVASAPISDIATPVSSPVETAVPVSVTVKPAAFLEDKDIQEQIDTAPVNDVTDNTQGDAVSVRQVPKTEDMPDPLDVLATSADKLPVEDVESDARPVAAFGVPEPSSLNAELAKALDDQLSTTDTKEAGASEPSTEEAPAAPLASDEQVPSVTESTEEVKDVAEPIQNESPFVPDPKVEKRPLNANTSSASMSEPLVSLDELMKQEMPVEETPSEESTVDNTVADEPPLVPTVPELASDLVAIEATGKVVEVEADESTAKPGVDSVGSTVEQAENSGPASITQQYKAGESSGDSSHAPIYDASQYADPITHPAKKRSGWLLVLSILILLALGSGGAVALYFMGIIP